MNGKGRIHVKHTLIAVIATASACFMVAPTASHAFSRAAEASSDVAITSSGVTPLLSLHQSASARRWTSDTVPASDASGGAMAMILLAALSMAFLAASLIIRNAQLPRRPGAATDVKRALGLIAKHWPQQIDASHIALLRS